MLALVLLVAATGCGGAEERSQAAATPREPACPKEWKDGWQELADRIGAPVYCPSWMPTPLDGEIEGQWNNINSVGKNGDYLMGFTWYEVMSGEVHVNFRGRPSTTEIPTCQEVETEAGKTRRRNVPCFADPQGTKRLGGREVTVYTRNRGADVWHVLYAWEEDGALYAVSQHVAEPHTYSEVVEHLDKITTGLVRIEPRSA
jgi:hypothetical protein